MAACDHCGSTILFGGKRENGFRYCSDKCLQKGYLQPRLDAVPPEILESEIKKLHDGPCPKCGGSGPVDVHTSHKIWSLIYLSFHSSKPEICCRSCGRKSQTLSTLFCLFLGWWSLHGLIMTPIQIIQNILGIMRPPRPDTASPALRKIVQTALAEEFILAAASPGAPAAPMAPIPTSKATTTPPAVQNTGKSASPFSDLGNPLK